MPKTSLYGCVLRVAKAGGAVAQRALTGLVAADFVKTGRLRGNALGAAGATGMRHERDFIQLVWGIQAKPSQAKALQPKAQPAHA